MGIAIDFLKGKDSEKWGGRCEVESDAIELLWQKMFDCMLVYCQK